MSKPCTCTERGGFHGCLAHDASTRTPEEVEAHIEALRAERAERAADRRRHWYGGTEDIWDELTEEVSS